MFPMSEDEKKAQIQQAILEYVKLKGDLAHIKKKLDDFRSATMVAYNLTASGGLHAQRGKSASDWKNLLNGAELTELLAEYFFTVDHIAELADYLKAIGYGGVVS